MSDRAVNDPVTLIRAAKIVRGVLDRLIAQERAEAALPDYISTGSGDNGVHFWSCYDHAGAGAGPWDSTAEMLDDIAGHLEAHHKEGA